MPATLQFWFDFASTYSYLSAMRVEQDAAACGVRVDWQPFLLGPIFAEQGWKTSPFNIYPAKGRYMWRDMERLCRQHGLPLTRPAEFPQNSLKAARLALAIPQREARAAFSCAVFAAQFGQGLNISVEPVLRSALSAAGLPEDMIDRTADSDIKSALFDQVARAKSLGIFGAPSFVVDEELYWGDDRLDMAIRQAAAI
ncbi:2-hydroxychromene-2-carboxylate isomerase [Ruegeria arenilitoris]|uniref:2-hydroxychromene-2-carboxylate isomerase n=1 Tax=Ruegeria arenilitoris TaxID=1173585 RepID=UPI00147E2AF7|nr:2-hydroxychromene-2-carboxylate isomerase [Ruegeria arenilitoris]